jgi:hypothetical protein
LHSNGLVSAVPNELGSLRKLRQLFLQQNRLTGSIVSVESPVLEIYDIRSNEFTGRLPLTLFEHPSLKILSMSDNCISTDFSHIVDCDIRSNIQGLFLIGIGQNGRYILYHSTRLHYE